MKAVVLDKFGIDHFNLREIKTPKPLRNEVLVKIKAVSLNYLDGKLADGSFSNTLPFPYIPGSVNYHGLIKVDVLYKSVQKLLLVARGKS
jgi:NADPH:quinone reductase-like Zn-dependent oxidoreductase